MPHAFDVRQLFSQEGVMKDTVFERDFFFSIAILTFPTEQVVLV